MKNIFVLLLAVFIATLHPGASHAVNKTIAQYTHGTPDNADAILVQQPGTDTTLGTTDDQYAYILVSELASFLSGGSYQAQDDTLDSLSLLGTAADKFAYTTGVDTWAEADITAAGRAILDDIDTAAQRTTLGLVIGTNVQAYDAELSAWAGLTSAADKLGYFTGSGTAGTTDFTSFGRSLLDDTDASTARSTLGLGTLATQSGTFSGTSSGTNTGDQTITLTGDVTGTGTGSFAATIASSAVTNAKMADMAMSTFKGRKTASTGAPEDMSVSDVKTLLALASTDISDFNEAAQDAVGAMVDSTLAYTDGTPELGVVDNTSTQKVEVNKNTGSVVGTRKQINFIEGANVTLTVSDNAGDDAVDVTIASSGGGGGGGLSDADYGDITVSGTGTVMTIDAGAVSYSKIQNVSATDKLLGRSTAGAGSIEEIACDSTCRALLDDTSTSAQRTTLGLAIGTNVQAYDADLTTYAGITPSANVQSLLGAADYAAMRTALSLVPGTDVQAQDAELAALAGLASAANKVPMFSGSGTATMLDFKDEDNMVSDSATAVPSQQSVKAYVDAHGGGSGDVLAANYGTDYSGNYALLRSNIGLAIGTNVQAYDAELSAWAGLTSAADKLGYFTGAGTAGTTDFTAAGRQLVGLSPASGNIPYFTGTTSAGVFASTTAGRALVGLTGSADALPYFTSSAAATTTTLTSTARSLLDDTSITAMKTTLGLRQEYCVAMSDQTTSLATGTGKAYLYLPAAATVLNVRAYVNTAPTGAAIKVDVNEAGTTLMTTNKITIDTSTKTSLSAGTQPTLTDTSIAANAEITFDIDQVGSTIAGKGLVACIEVSM